MFGGAGNRRKRFDLGIAAFGAYRKLCGPGAYPLVIAARAGVDEVSGDWASEPGIQEVGDFSKGN